MSEGLALIIEDDFDASVIFAKAIEAIGYQTEIIDSGDLALKRLQEIIPGIVVLDLHLPEVLGTDILKSIRGDERLANTKVIVATADPRSADIIQDMADLVLIKPTTYSQVRDFAERLTTRSQKREQEARATAEAAVVTESGEKESPNPDAAGGPDAVAN
jgi:DNA-binding response OmpR family regulator